MDKSSSFKIMKAATNVEYSANEELRLLTRDDNNNNEHTHTG